MTFRAWVNDDNGVHTPSQPFATRRDAEIFASRRSAFRRDVFVLVRRDDEPIWLSAYRNGRLADRRVGRAWDAPDAIDASRNVWISVRGLVYTLKAQS